jgi:hypothetical protein
VPTASKGGRRYHGKMGNGLTIDSTEEVGKEAREVGDIMAKWLNN